MDVNSVRKSTQVNFPTIEEEVLENWKREKTFEKSVALRRRGKRFVFYEGPPTANGRPGIHHVLTRAFKDIILRYKTMRGFLVERKAGWDTHGLAVEIATEKKLGLKSKKDIEQYGIEKFNAECKKSVWEYKRDWENLTERIGFWIDMNDPFITHDTSYVETLWHVIKRFWDKGLLYKDYRIVPYCSRCGTPLSSHEVSQGYKTVKEPALFVKFQVSKTKLRIPANTFILAWTTTPWTLPANVALAVNIDISYVLCQKDSEYYILAKDLAAAVLGEHKVVRTVKGNELVGLEYIPLFRFARQAAGEKAWSVVPASFVSVREGTGIVHIAPAYGEDDFQLRKKENLPLIHLVDEQGKFTQEVSPWSSRFVKDVDPLIREDLKSRGLLFKQELYEHEYPFCWRCSTPLLYYAKDSWFVNMQKVKTNLLKNSTEISWVPSHVKEGRFGEWLKEVRDWAYSRERYWGTPLPVWQCNQCGASEVIGSLEELKKQNFTTNNYYILRHGHSQRQMAGTMSCWPEIKPFPLTPKGAKQIEKVARDLKGKRIDAIFASDLLRTRQTAEILQRELGINLQLDKRLREWDIGTLNGKPAKELGKVWGRPDETSQQHYLRRFAEPMPGGESYTDVQRRMYGFVQEIDTKHQGKNILIVSHELPLTMLETTMLGLSRKESIRFRQEQKKYLEPGEWRQLPFAKLSLNKDMELDIHRPYVDEVKFSCSKCKGGTMERVKEVVDVWFDSGAMPFAQSHWPFSQALKQKPPASFPADYIVEGIDQTRGWFYTLLAVATLLGFRAPYKNVIALSHVLDEKGEKMSKSKGNVVNPWDMVARYGADAVRWYFYTINNPGDPKLFSERDVQQATRNFLLTLWNCFVFYKTYNPKIKTQKSKIQPKGKNLLDRWILSRLTGTTQEVTQKLDSYDVTSAGRTLQDFVVNDLSLWYIRRSRSRAKQAGKVLGFVLTETCKLTAPFIPFLSEHIFQAIANKARKAPWPSGLYGKSVHLADWPKAKTHNAKLEMQMVWVRSVVAKALAERTKAGIKVRQPLQKLKVKSDPFDKTQGHPERSRTDEKLKVSDELLRLIKDEVNVKEVVFNKNLKSEVELDTTLTPELKEEGLLREIVRSIQGMRKEAGYQPKDRVILSFEGDGELQKVFLSQKAFILRAVGARVGKIDSPDIKKDVDIEGKKLHFSIKKG